MIRRKNPVTNEEEVITRPIEDIGIIMIESGQVTLTSALISHLVENNVGVIFCDSRHMPINMILPLQANTLQSEKSIAQIQASLPLKKQLWQQTVAAKIFNQGVVLGKVAGVETSNMFKWSTGVKVVIQIILRVGQRHIIGEICSRKQVASGEIKMEKIPLTHFSIMDMPF